MQCDVCDAFSFSCHVMNDDVRMKHKCHACIHFSGGGGRLEAKTSPK